MLSGFHDSFNRLALQRTPLYRRHNLLCLVRRLAIGRQHPLGPGVHGHGHIVGVRDWNAHDGHHSSSVEHGQVVAQLAAAAGIVLCVDNDVIQADTR